MSIVEIEGEIELLVPVIDIEVAPPSSPGGGVVSITAGAKVAVDSTDPANPVVSAPDAAVSPVEIVTFTEEDTQPEETYGWTAGASARKVFEWTPTRIGFVHLAAPIVVTQWLTGEEDYLYTHLVPHGEEMGEGPHPYGESYDTFDGYRDDTDRPVFPPSYSASVVEVSEDGERSVGRPYGQRDAVQLGQTYDVWVGTYYENATGAQVDVGSVKVLLDVCGDIEGGPFTDPYGMLVDLGDAHLGLSSLPARVSALEEAPDGDVGAVPESLIDAKGDLIVGTADNTAGRLAAGTNGHVLTLDSGEATGMKWAAPGGSSDTYAPPAYPMLSGHYFQSAIGVSGTTLTTMAAAGRLIMGQAIWISGSVDQFNLLVSSGATATWRFGLVPVASTGLPDWASVITAGTASMAANVEISMSSTLAGGWYFPVALVDSYTANPSVFFSNTLRRDDRGWPQGFSNGSPSSGAQVAMYWTGVATGALPTSSPGTPTMTNQVPVFRIRKA